MVLAQTSRKFGCLPSQRLGIADRAVALDLDNAAALRLIVEGTDDQDVEEEFEDVPAGPAPARGERARTTTIYY